LVYIISNPYLFISSSLSSMAKIISRFKIQQADDPETLVSSS